MTSRNSIVSYLDQILPRISEETAERIKARFYFVVGFIVRWALVVGIEWYCYETLPDISNVPMAQLTLRMIGGAIFKPVIAIVVFFGAFKKGEKYYEIWGWVSFWVIIFGVSIWVWLVKYGFPYWDRHFS